MHNKSTDLKIVGFGVSMIGGYPLRAGGMLEVASDLIERRLSRSVRTTIVNPAGSSAPHAEKHLQGVLSSGPDYVVFEFGSTDAHCPIYGAGRSSTFSDSLGAFDKDAESYHNKAPTFLITLSWELASLIGYIWKVDPITPMPQHVAAIMRMARACRARGATPVVLSPFIYGSRCATRNAIAYTDALRDLAKVQDMILVDCVSTLQTLPKFSVLQADGFHLSQTGHYLVGHAIADSIAADVLAGSRAA